MPKSVFHILRVGIAITFLWVGVLIFRSPEAWGSLLLPWASGLLPLSLKTAMIATAVLDILIGFFLLVDVLTFPASLVGAFHLITVLTAVGINEITVRDIGLLAGTLALIAGSWPRAKGNIAQRANRPSEK